MTTASSVGNLTTTFTPAPSCLTDYYRFNASYIYTEDDGQVQTYQYTALGPTSTSACVPSGFAPAAAYYSPGICPSGYFQACSSVVTSGSATETQATCCPINYACQTQTPYPWPWYSTEACTLSFFQAGAQTLNLTSSVSSDSTTTISTTINGGVNAFGISIRYQAATTTSSSTTTSSTASPSVASQTSTTPTPTTSTSPTSSLAPASSTGLSPGAIAGIVIGVVALIAILAFLAFFILRSKRAQLYVPELPGQMVQDQLKHQYPQQVMEMGMVHGDMDADVRHELNGAVGPQELPAGG